MLYQLSYTPKAEWLITRLGRTTQALPWRPLRP